MATEAEDLSKLSDEELEARLKAAEEKRQEKRKEANKAIRRREQEERIKLAELEEQHGTVDVDITPVFSPNDGRMVVMKKAKPITYNRFQQKMLKDKLSEQDVTEYAYANLIYPTQAEFEQICESCAEMRMAACGAASKLAGAGRVDIEGK